MIDFWNMTDEDDNSGEFESGGFTLIPDNTKVLMSLNKAEWKEPGPYDASGSKKYINITWQILSPQEYKNMYVFQKIRPLQEDKSKVEKAHKMLRAIDYHAGRKLFKLGKEPSDDDLSLCLKRTIVCGTIRTWEQNGLEGNWVAGVSGRDKYQKQQRENNKTVEDFDDDEIPF